MKTKKKLIVRQKKINIHRLNQAQLLHYSKLLYGIFSRSIKGWSHQQFAQDFFYKMGLYNNDMSLFYNEKGVLIGFNLHQVIKIKHEGNWHYIIKFYAVLLPEFKKNNLMRKDVYIHIAKLKMKHPLSRVYFVDLAMSPVSYYQLVHYCLQTHPRPGIETPLHYKKLIHLVAKEYDIVLIDEDKCVGRSHEYVYLSKEEKEAWMQSSEPKIQFFVEHAGLEGNGLFVLIHVTFYTIMSSLFQMIKNTIRRKK